MVTPGAWGVSLPLPIAYQITSRLADRYKVELFTRPAGIVSGTVCRDTGGSPAEGVTCEKEATVYISGRAPQVDNRKVITVCSANGLVPSNLTQAQKYGLVQTKTVLTFKIENKLQSSTYEKYMVENGGYLLSDPPTGECPLPLGPDNSPIVELDTPTEGSVFKKSATMNITGSTRQLETLTEFIVSIDGTPISGVVWTGSQYSVSKVLSSLGAGNHVLTVTAKDNYGKIGTKSITFKVEADQITPEVQGVNKKP